MGRHYKIEYGMMNKIMKKKHKYLVLLMGLLIILLSSLTFCVVNSYYVISLENGATLRVFKASIFNKRNSVIMIIPGGGYKILSKWNEGYYWAPFLYSLGYTVAVLEYRVPVHNYAMPMSDAFKAITAIKKMIDNDTTLGLMGFSAGGHLASTMMVLDSDSLRPDFVLLFYPVVSMKKELTHLGSRNKLLGERPSDELECQFSNELHISDKNPPVFIAVSKDDDLVNPQNSIVLYNAIKAKGRHASLHIYPEGGHGWGYRSPFPYRKQMITDMVYWLDSLNKMQN